MRGTHSCTESLSLFLSLSVCVCVCMRAYLYRKRVLALPQGTVFARGEHHVLRKRKKEDYEGDSNYANASGSGDYAKRVPDKHSRFSTERCPKRIREGEGGGEKVKETRKEENQALVSV